MKIWRKTFNFSTVDSPEFIKCSYCGSERLQMIGDVLECVYCKGVKALN